MLASALVAVATALATRSGPTLLSILIGFPMDFFSIDWTFHDRYGADVARVIIAAGHAQPCYFCCGHFGFGGASSTDDHFSNRFAGVTCRQ
jgi:hypothetical protein